MTNESGVSLQDIASRCGGRLLDPSRAEHRIVRVAPVDGAGEDSVTWVTDSRHARGLSDCKAGGIIGTDSLLEGDPRGIAVDDPELAMVRVLGMLGEANTPPAVGIHPTAVVDAGAEIGNGVAIGALAIVGPGVRIGDDSVIHEGVSLGAGVTIGCRSVIYDRCVVYDRCSIGNDCILHAGVIIGADGFGYVFRNNRHVKFPHIGTVQIEDDVEIGANACIDRGKFGATRIGRGSKIDNLVQVAHNVDIGPLSVVVAQCGLAGSARLGTGVILAGHVGVVESVAIGDGVRVGAQSVVTRDTQAGAVLLGYPARDHRKALREQAHMRRIGEYADRIAALEKRIAELEASKDHS